MPSYGAGSGSLARFTVGLDSLMWLRVPIGVRHLIVASVIVLAACAPTRPAAPKPEEQVAAIAQGAYRPAGQYVISEVRETWRYRDATVEVAVIAPSSAKPHSLPLVIYLPGLGESIDGGHVWREAWAAAGYITLAVQPASLGVELWRSQKARGGEFESIAKEHFATPAAKARFDYLDFVVSEVRRRATANDPALATADLSRIVLAGFDLGTQTIAATFVRHTPGEPARNVAWNVRAVILMSPYIDRADRDMGVLYGGIAIPSLTVTGTGDVDPFNLLPSAGMRTLPWQAMPTGEKFQLLLSGGSHSMLAGSSLIESTWTGSAGPGAPAGERKGNGQSGGRNRKGGGGANPGGFQFDSPSAAEGGAQQGSEGRGESGRRAASPSAPGQGGGARSFDVLQIAAIQVTSTAFLDATVKSSDGARQWLARDAVPWLGSSGSIQAK